MHILMIWNTVWKQETESLKRRWDKENRQATGMSWRENAEKGKERCGEMPTFRKKKMWKEWYNENSQYYIMKQKRTLRRQG